MKISAGNRYDLQEVAGAFGDLGTLIPFVVGYITINRMDPAGILVAFGVFKLWAGLYFKTPVPIQPMKAIGTAAIAHAGAITSGAVWASGLFTGAVWLILGLCGAVTWIAKITSRPVVQGIVLGLGLGFMLEGVKMMQGDLLLAALTIPLTFLLLSYHRIPAMLVLLAVGSVLAIVRDPGLVGELARMSFHFRLPVSGLAQIGWGDLAAGILVLGLPQLPLTLGNAIVSTVEENNSLFPDRPITVKTVALDHGLLNLVGTALGGVPMCHGAGGMAGHVRFGARTGGALVILGGLILFTGLFLADSVATLFKVFPPVILGVILLFGGLELASGVKGNDHRKEDRYVMFLTAGISLWNMGAGYLTGLVLWYAFQRRWLRA
ncbi:MAG TPA: putative sulfate/molybdate transporter [Candidatus Methylomirabilis sp.]|nr:putative sulfate/molybdate transporter [Candidatus Methylomirabilis sp.]